MRLTFFLLPEKRDGIAAAVSEIYRIVRAVVERDRAESVFRQASTRKGPVLFLPRENTRSA
jgi:hypothetical protein